MEDLMWLIMGIPVLGGTAGFTWLMVNGKIALPHTNIRKIRNAQAGLQIAKISAETQQAKFIEDKIVDQRGQYADERVQRALNPGAAVIVEEEDAY